MTNPELQALVKARIRDVEKRNKATEAARSMEKGMRKGRF